MKNNDCELLFKGLILGMLLISFAIVIGIPASIYNNALRKPALKTP